MKNQNASFIAALMLTLSSGVASANTQQSTDTAEPVETIEVVGQRPMRFYRQQYFDKQNAYYDMYNQLVKDRTMQMKCGMKEVEFGRRKKERVCEPVFVNLIQTDENRKAMRMNNGDIGYALMSPNFKNKSSKRIEAEKKKMAKIMFDMVNSNPELREKYLEYRDAKEEFISRKQDSKAD